MASTKLVSVTDHEASDDLEQDLIFELDDSAQCLWVNDRVKETFGDVRGKQLEEIFSNQPEMLKRYQEIQDGQEFLYFEVPDDHCWEIRGIRNNGSLSGTVITGQPTPNNPLEPLPPSAWSYDLISNSLTLSRRVADVLGFGDTTIDLAVARSIRPKELNPLMSGFKQLILGRAELFVEEFEISDIFNQQRWLSIRGQVAVRTQKGQVIGLNGSIEDITMRVNENHERRALESKMLRFQKMEAIGELAGGIAHDFNNILTSVMGYTELALMETPPGNGAKLQTYLQEIYQGGRRARDLVSKMLTFSRSDKNEPRKLDLMREVKDIVKMLRASLPSLIEIRIDMDENLPEVFIDPQFLHQMVMNICINARDAMPSGGTIHIRARQKELRRNHCDSCHVEFAGDYVELSIEDTGIGISDDVIERIFEPYISSKNDGSGMGLAMVHGIMHRQGGHIKVDSLLDDGTEVRLFLKSAEQTEVLAPKTPYTHIPPTQLQGKRILVVDDEVSLVYFMRELLQKKGFDVTVASDSHEAWDIFSANPDAFDLVVTDQTMPGLSGVQLAGKMITLKPELPVMLCTGYSDVVDESNVSQYGIQAYMPKPIDSKEFLRSIEELLVSAQASQS